MTIMFKVDHGITEICICTAAMHIPIKETMLTTDSDIHIHSELQLKVVATWFKEWEKITKGKSLHAK